MRDASKLYSMGRGKPTKVQTPKGASSIHIHPSMTMYTTYKCTTSRRYLLDEARANTQRG